MNIKIIVILFFCGIELCSFADFHLQTFNSKQFYLSTDTTQYCRVIPFKGLDSFQLNKSNLNLVEIKYGKGINSKTKFREGFFDIKKVTKSVEYVDLGLTFIAQKQRCRNIYIINQIVLKKNNQCKTKMGNGIGSSYDSLVKEFPDISYSKLSSISGKETVLSFSDGTGSIKFVCNGWIEKEAFIVEQIVLYSW